MNALAAVASNQSHQAAAKLVEAVTGGGSIVSFEDEAACGRIMALDQVAAQLGRSRVRVLRAAAPASGQLGLPELVAQIAGQADPGALSDGDVERAFQALTEPDEGCEWIALLVDDAERLLPSALRYIQLTCRAVPELRVVLAGEPGFLGMLDGDEFTALRQRLTCPLPQPAASEERITSAETAPPVLAEAEPPAQVPARRPLELWAFIVLAMLASLWLGVWAAHRDQPSGHAETAVAAEG